VFLDAYLTFCGLENGAGEGLGTRQEGDHYPDSEALADPLLIQIAHFHHPTSSCKGLTESNLVNCLHLDDGIIHLSSSLQLMMMTMTNAIII